MSVISTAKGLFLEDKVAEAILGIVLAATVHAQAEYFTLLGIQGDDEGAEHHALLLGFAYCGVHVYGSNVAALCEADAWNFVQS